jgi:hypothetical protein
MNIELIKWYDHEHGDGGFHDKGTVEDWAGKEPPSFLSVGWVIFEDEIQLTIVSIKDVDQYAGGMKILKSCIRSRQTLAILLHSSTLGSTKTSGGVGEGK